uniref:Uncharacterized protein n=1 Tax=Acrobeloides nanus TaxID=290746 RepID=A0A914DJ29_9BILA
MKAPKDFDTKHSITNARTRTRMVLVEKMDQQNCYQVGLELVQDLNLDLQDKVYLLNLQDKAHLRSFQDKVYLLNLQDKAHIWSLQDKAHLRSFQDNAHRQYQMMSGRMKPLCKYLDQGQIHTKIISQDHK